jgi:hypothetical protein
MPESLAANGARARMMATIGYESGMSLSKNPLCIVPSPHIQGKFKDSADQDCGEQIKCAACNMIRDLGLIVIDE